jgi:hypothetical protein
LWGKLALALFGLSHFFSFHFWINRESPL